MIVEPDFIDHWKTRLLVRLLGTESAPIYVLRLWSHCQSRKTDRFTDWHPEVLASVCRWDGDAKTLWDGMLKTFCVLEGGAFVARGWAETNAALFSAWNNGKLGGRPRKQAENNPQVTRPDTHGQSDREEERREDKTRVEKNPSSERRTRFVTPTREEINVEAEKIGLPESEVDKFVHYYGANGWKIGRVPMKSWPHALKGWHSRWKEGYGRRPSRNEPAPKSPDDAAF